MLSCLNKIYFNSIQFNLRNETTASPLNAKLEEHNQLIVKVDSTLSTTNKIPTNGVRRADAARNSDFIIVAEKVASEPSRQKTCRSQSHSLDYLLGGNDATLQIHWFLAERVSSIAQVVVRFHVVFLAVRVVRVHPFGPLTSTSLVLCVKKI